MKSLLFFVVLSVAVFVEAEPITPGLAVLGLKALVAKKILSSVSNNGGLGIGGGYNNRGSYSNRRNSYNSYSSYGNHRSMKI